MNGSEFASVLYRTFSNVIPSGSNDDKDFQIHFKFVIDRSFYIPSRTTSPQQDIFD